MFFFVLFFSASAFKEEKDSKRQFLKQTKLKKEFKKSKNILNILLPDFVRERIRTGQRFISEDQGVVTITFVDFVDFDDIVSMYQPGELIEFLDKMYNAFDQMCNLHNLQKIETVGKSYMACGGLKAIEKDFKKDQSIKHHTVRIINFCFEVLDYVKKRNLKNGAPIRVKIGVHTGRVISGVVGQHKPQFSLVGDTVNRTSRMCSKAVHNRVHMTEDTYKFLKHLPHLRWETQQTDAKGIGIITTYYALKKRTVARASKENIANIKQIQNDEEDKEDIEDHESEMFQDSEDSQYQKSENPEEENNDMVGELQEISLIMEKEVQENAKYELFIFKKNVENYRLFFNLSCCVMVFMLGLSEVTVFGNDADSKISTERTIYLICLGIMAVLAILFLYLSPQLKRRSPRTTVLAILFFYIV
mmetsp:Transcript_17701/g.17417  ORF Transcript_17701/g.17417 Transcript_17701/m.17417 type:complete len:417 (-) Transcript_17701:994-2244(-)